MSTLGSWPSDRRNAIIFLHHARRVEESLILFCCHFLVAYFLFLFTRDVGEALDGLGQNERSPWIFPKGILTRGGEIGMIFDIWDSLRYIFIAREGLRVCKSKRQKRLCFLDFFPYLCRPLDLVHPDKIENPKTVLNLRNMSDDLTVPLFTQGGCQHVQSAMAREVEKYHTHQTEVRKWLDSILIMIQKFDPSQRLPLMVRLLLNKCIFRHHFWRHMIYFSLLLHRFTVDLAAIELESS